MLYIELQEYLLKNYENKSQQELENETGETMARLRFIAEKKLKLKKSGNCIFCGNPAKTKVNQEWCCSVCKNTTHGNKCKLCGKDIAARNTYCYECGRKVTGDSNRKHQQNFCKTCGKKISPQHNTCGKKRCMDMRSVETGHKVQRFCDVCGKEFFVTMYASKTKAAKFCSQKCYKEVFVPSFVKGDTFKFNGKRMRSSWEVKIASLLFEGKITYIYEPKRFGNYIPDFYLPDFDIYLEIKGWERPKAMKKLQDFIDAGNKTILINESVYNKLNNVEDIVQMLDNYQASCTTANL